MKKKISTKNKLLIGGTAVLVAFYFFNRNKVAKQTKQDTSLAVDR